MIVSAGGKSRHAYIQSKDGTGGPNEFEAPYKFCGDMLNIGGTATVAM